MPRCASAAVCPSGGRTARPSSRATAASWLPTDGDRAAVADEVHARAGFGAVPDDVAEADERVSPAGVRLGDDGLQRGEVGVDVGEDGEAHRAGAGQIGGGTTGRTPARPGGS